MSGRSLGMRVQKKQKKKDKKTIYKNPKEKTRENFKVYISGKKVNISGKNGALKPAF